MKRLLIIMLTICVWTNKVCAQFHSMNYDKETVAAMATAFGAEAVAEGYYSEQVGAILKHYNAAELYNPQIEMFARFKMKSSFHKTKRII